MSKKEEFILWFDELEIDDVAIVGGKNASLGEMYKNLKKKGIAVPNGFAITAFAYQYFVENAGIKDKINKILDKLDRTSIHDLRQRAKRVRNLILEAKIPKLLELAIFSAYDKLSKEYGKNCDVAVRSSATAEDLPDASFAGQQESYLNIRGEKALLEACKKCFASLFTDRAVSYRHDKGFNDFDISLSIAVQKMVRSDKACSGVIFTIDTESGFKDVVLVTASYGLGENVVKGAVNPDEYYVFKKTLGKAKNPVLMKKTGEKDIMMIYSGANKTKNIKTPASMKKRFVLSQDEIIKLADWACQIEEHYSKKAGYHKPMDLEWAKDGISGKLYIVQARPETVQSQKDVTVMEKYRLTGRGKVLCEGKSVGSKIGTGKTKVILDPHSIKKFKKGEVLVTDMTDPDWEPIMKISSAIITNKGGRTCHAAIVSRELGIPCIVGAGDATKKLKTGQKITADCSQGEIGYVYNGAVSFKVDKIDLKVLPKTKTKIMLNLGDPDSAFVHSALPVSGVGLAREEFIINSYIKIHPLALINYNKLKDEKAKKQIAELTSSYKDKKAFFVEKLAEGIAMIAAAFYPKEIIVRMSDFKTNEYANLIGGKEFEPKEENPMIGWRGASRYYSKYKEGFDLECLAIKKVRTEMGLPNVKIMIPFCRTVKEGEKVIDELKQNGLIRGQNGLEIYVMCEIPSNVILADQFSKIFDGFSIGSNDLTQLTLGLDRDSSLVAHIYDERNEAVKDLIRFVIRTAKKHRKKIGICGDGPSTFPDFAEFLVEEGIDSMSLTPDAVVSTLISVGKKEKKLLK